MRHLSLLAAVFGFTLLLAGCPGEGDDQMQVDAGSIDSGPRDGGSTTGDAGTGPTLPRPPILPRPPQNGQLPADLFPPR